MAQYYFKIYLSDDTERKILEKCAEAEGMSVSAYIKSRLPLPSNSKFQQALKETIKLAESLPATPEFSVPELYSPIFWKNMSTDVNVGQLGRRFFEQVENGNVLGVSFVKMKNNRAVYRKDTSTPTSEAFP